jgi:hypothetical protein
VIAFEAIERLRSIAESDGGAVLVCVGASEALFHAGCHRPPAESLLEALLTILDRPSYGTILVASSTGPHLPTVNLSQDFVVGAVPGIWALRSDEDPNQRVASELRPAREHAAYPDDLFASLPAPSVGERRVLHRNPDVPWVERVQLLLDNIEARCGQRWDGLRYEKAEEDSSRRRRSLIVVDERWLIAGAADLGNTFIPSARRNFIPRRFAQLPELVGASACDLVILCRTQESARRLESGGFIANELRQVGDGRAMEDLPELRLSGVEIINYPQSTRSAPWGSWLPGASRTSSLYEALREIPIDMSAADDVANPWDRKRLLAILSDASQQLGRRVKGQPAAVATLISTLRLSAMGLVGAHRHGASRQPRGVLFFAGPTGVGKTELVKAVAELIFGTEDAIARFDMGEYKSERALWTLLGPPSGHVGSETGGTLTGAVRRRPQQVVLFDEFEKAHPSLADPMLQLLDDGRLTDQSLGDTVSFADCLIVFTSNLGASAIKAGDSYEQIQTTMRGAISHYFREKIGRPEFLGRIGFPDNIVIFDAIGQAVASEIFELMVEKVLARVAESQGLAITLADQARRDLSAYCLSDLSLGARGLSKRIESAFTRALAEALAENFGELDGACEVTAWSRRSSGGVVELASRKPGHGRQA